MKLHEVMGKYVAERGEYPCNEYWSKKFEAAYEEDKTSTCEWEQDEDGNYFTKCDNVFFFDTGSLEDNKAKYCMYCGKIIKEIKGGLNGY